MSDAEEIFLTPESEARLDLIRHLIENSELVPLVRGISGIGKSLLASRLQDSAPKNWVVCHFAADSMMQPERLLAHIARCNGIPDGNEENLRRLVERFELLRKRGSIPVLLIDDAQSLPPTSLITLLRLYERQVGGGPLVSLVLFADEQIDMLLSTPQLQIMSPQSIQVIDLPPLTREEADAYMRYLLRVEGLDPSLALDANRMNRIYRDTQGAPGPLGKAILEEVGEADGKSSGGGFKVDRRLIWGAIPVGLLVILLLIFQGPVNRLFSPDLAPAVEPEAAPVAVEREETAQVHPVIPPLPVPAEPAAPAEALAAEPSAQTESSALQAEEKREPGPDREVSQVATDTPRVDGGSAETAVEPEPGRSLASGQADRIPPIQETATPDADTREDAGVSSRLPEPPEAVTPPVAPEPALAQPEPEAPPREASPSFLKSPDWLGEQPPGSYTVQLLAVENIESIQPVVQKYSLEGKVFSVRTQRKGHAWYPLLWGRYANRDEAVAAIKRLPPALRKGGAWARTFASLLP